MRQQTHGVLRVASAAALALFMAAAAAEECRLRLALDEKDGPACQDSSGHGNEADIVGGRRIGDESGGALECDGARPGRDGAGAILRDSGRLRPGSAFTVAAWVNLTVEPKEMKGPWPSVVYRFGANACGFRLGFLRDENAAFFKWGDGTSIHGYGVKSREHAWGRGWRHLTGVFSKTPAIYADGELSNRVQTTGGFKDMGGDFIVGHGGFVGIVDEVVFYDRALNADEVRALYMSATAYAGARNVRVSPRPAPIAQTPAPRPANLIPGDGDFESGMDHRWEHANTTVVRAGAARGTACAHLDGSRDSAHLETDDITVDVEKPHTFSAFLKGKGKATLFIVTVNADDPYDANGTKTQTVTLADSWQRHSLTLDPGWNTKNQWSTVARSGHKFRAGVRIWRGSSCMADALQFEEGGQPTDYVSSQPAHISISTDAPCNVFLTGEPVAATFRSYLPDKAAASLRLKVRDFNGDVVHARTAPLEPNDSAAQVAETLPVRTKGFYTIHAELIRGEKRLAESSATFCVVAPPRDVPVEESFFGLQGPLSEERAEAMRRIGVKWFRMGIGWIWIERKRGEFTWESSDERVGLLRSKGMAVMGLVSGTPEWARSETPKDEWRVWAYPPKDMKDLENFMAAAAAHFRGKVDCWEIWNESCLDYFKVNPASGRPKGEVFAEVLRAAHAGAKKGNPDCVVAVNPITNKVVPFLDEVLKSASDAFDVLNIHPYTGRVRIGIENVTTPEEFGVIEFAHEAARIMKEKARGQEVWNSEQGFTLDMDAPPDGVHAKDFAKYMARSFLLQRASPVRRLFWFMSYDQRLSNNRKGMWRHGRQPLPVVAAYAALAHVLDGCKGARSVKVAGASPYPLQAFAFGRDKGGAVALWLGTTTSRKLQILFPAAGRVEMLDIMGNPVGEMAGDGQCAAPLSDFPLYVVSDDTPWEQLAAAVERGRIIETPEALRPLLRVPTPLKLDGDLGDWPARPALNDFAAACDREKMYLAFAVEEPPTAHRWSANLLRLGNCLRLRLALGDQASELLVGEGPGGVQVYRVRGTGKLEAGLVREAQGAIKHTDGKTCYEIGIPLSALTPTPPEAGATLDLQFEGIQNGQEGTAQQSARLSFQP